MRYEKQRDAFDGPNRVPALLSGFIDLVLQQYKIRIAENQGGGFKADFVLGQIRFGLCRVPLKSILEIAHDLIVPTSE